MAQWASWVGLDKDEDDDESDELPTTEDANRMLDFVKMLGEWLFVFPQKVKRGIQSASDEVDDSALDENGDEKGRASLLNDGMD
jgi:hypothetical protein